MKVHFGNKDLASENLKGDLKFLRSDSKELSEESEGPWTTFDKFVNVPLELSYKSSKAFCEFVWKRLMTEI